MPTKAELEGQLERLKELKALKNLELDYLAERYCMVEACDEEAEYGATAPNGNVTDFCGAHMDNLKCFLGGFGVDLEL